MTQSWNRRWYSGPHLWLDWSRYVLLVYSLADPIFIDTDDNRLLETGRTEAHCHWRFSCWPKAKRDLRHERDSSPTSSTAHSTRAPRAVWGQGKEDWDSCVLSDTQWLLSPFTEQGWNIPFMCRNLTNCSKLVYNSEPKSSLRLYISPAFNLRKNNTRNR